MTMNQTPSGERTHIGFFGRRNAGKSSLVNAVTGQELAVVSDVKGTTTDPVTKAMELLPLGPVLIIDTPGFDDEGALGEKRVKKTRQILNKTDIAILVVDASEGMKDCDRELLAMFEEKKIPHLVVYNKCDLQEADGICVSAMTGAGIHELKEKIAALKPIRDILDAGAAAIVVKESELEQTLKNLGKAPAVVITDSQVFKSVAKIVPREVPLTSFSILMARYKGLLEEAAKGVHAISNLKDGDKILISEGCTHHRQCEDIGTVKIPRWIKAYTDKDITIETSSGGGFPEDLTRYALVVHCGGCMLGEREVMYRVKCAADQGVPITNYGTLVAHMNGILPRSLEILKD